MNSKKQWALIMLMMLLSSVSTLYITKQYLMPQFKTVNITEILKDTQDLKQLILSNKLTKQEYKKLYTQKVKLIAKAVKQVTSQNDVVLIKDAIIETNSVQLIDITTLVNKYVKENTIYINK